MPDTSSANLCVLSNFLLEYVVPEESSALDEGEQVRAVRWLQLGEELGERLERLH